MYLFGYSVNVSPETLERDPMKSLVSLQGNQWAAKMLLYPEVKEDSGGETSCWRGGLSGQLYSYKPVKYKCYAVAIYFQMALLRQRTAQGSNAAEIEKKIKR